ncbi:VOC family protein [Halorarum salinum]|uniref:VOC family protein n=1 Tax=Halorarum salinum TaxID=2743089 RepID=A0A7D5L8E9_9EURY|nr:VOC family protein [Halobaculum salinum]QLG60332.1 VOC family protein [Halobaculum salinum]
MTTDLKRSREFYTKVLGLEAADESENSIAFDTGECTLKIERDHDEAALEAFGMESPGDDRGRGIIVVVAVDDIDAVHERASDHDAGEALTEPRMTDWDRYLCMLRDPDGYVIEASRPQ